MTGGKEWMEPLSIWKEWKIRRRVKDKRKRDIHSIVHVQ